MRPKNLGLATFLLIFICASGAAEEMLLTFYHSLVDSEGAFIAYFAAEFAHL